MNKRLQKQIKAYAGFASVFLIADKASGQIVYTDINPDTLLSAQPVNSGTHHFLLDIDGDAVGDIDLLNRNSSSVTWGITSILVSPQNSNQIGNRSYNGSTGIVAWPAKLNYGDTVSANGDWKNNALQCIRYVGGSGSAGVTSCGAWSWGTDKYLPFRLVQGSNYYYGWIRMETIFQGDILLKEYAYNTQPNIQLRAGYTTLSTAVGENDPHFNFSQQNNSILISTFQN
jgi:hypothetical protein